MFRTIRSRVAIPYILLTLATMIGLTLYLSTFSRQVYLDNTRAQIMDEAILIADLAQPMFGSANAQAELGALARRYTLWLGARVSIISADGVVLGESHGDATELNSLDRPEMQQALATGEGFSASLYR